MPDVGPKPSQVPPILVAGGANVDRIAHSLDRVAMATSNPVAMRETFGGVARNVAENLARLGLPVRLLTAVGDDPAGAALLRHARALGLDPEPALVVPGAVTGSYTALLEPDGELALGMCDLSVLERLTPAELDRRRPVLAASPLRVADLNLRQDVLEALRADSLERGAALVLVAVSEPKMARLPRNLEGISLLILNAGELAVLAGHALAGPEQAAAAALPLLDRGLGGLAVTLGPAGVVCAAPGREPAHLPAPPVRVVDVTGAGDAFSAGVVAALDRTGLDGACRFGQRLAALTLASAASVAPELGPALLASLPSSRRPSCILS